jgi:hypothetical protein
MTVSALLLHAEGCRPGSEVAVSLPDRLGAPAEEAEFLGCGAKGAPVALDDISGDHSV